MATKRKAYGKTRFLLSIAFILIVTAAYVLGWSLLFTVRQVVVIGAPNPSESFAMEHAVHLGDKMARIDTQALKHSFEKFSWLDHSSVHKNWLKGTVTVYVWPREPIALFQNHLVDHSGVIFDLPGVGFSGLPLIVGPSVSSVKFAAFLITELSPQLKAQILNVAVHGNDFATLSLKEPTLNRIVRLTWGDQSNMSFKIRVYQALMALPENSTITTIDLSAPHAPIVK
jgi:cell division septal protein FtsQ